jgi:hypothetical protein
MQRTAHTCRTITICIVAALLSIAGCSSSTEPAGAAGPAHLTSTVVASSTSVPVGGIVTAQWTIENTGSEPFHHAFGFPSTIGYGLEISVTPAASVLQSQGSDLLFSVNDSLNLPPHGRLRLNAIFKAVAVGTATLQGCLPPDSAETDGANCASTDVRVVSGF